MDYVFLIISSIIVLTCFYFIFAPFLSQRDRGLVAKDNAGDELTLESIYRAVNELEMDYLMKKLNEADYLSMKEQYQLLAAGLLKQEEKSRKASSKKSNGSEKIDLEILTELQKLRKQKG